MESDGEKQKIEMRERHKFFKFARTKKNNQSTEDFITDLKEMAKFCNFGQNKEKNIRDMVIQAIEDETLLNMILEQELNLDNVKHMCKAFENAIKKEDLVEKIVPNEAKSEKIYTKSESFNKPCWRCKEKHDFGKCPGLKCNYCKEVGHYTKSCPKIAKKRNNYPRLLTDNADCKSYNEGKPNLSSFPVNEKNKVYMRQENLHSNHLVKNFEIYESRKPEINPNQFSSRTNFERQTSSTANFTSKDPLSPITTGIILPSAPPAALMDFSIEEDFKIKSEFEKNKNKPIEEEKVEEEKCCKINYQVPQGSSGQPNYKKQLVKKKRMSNSECVIW